MMMEMKTNMMVVSVNMIVAHDNKDYEYDHYIMQ